MNFINILKKKLINNFEISILFSIILILLFSIILIYSSSNKNIVILQNRVTQIIVGLLLMILSSQISPRIYEKYSPLLYITSIILLIMVNIFGQCINGAKRWLNIYDYIKFQPSEFTRITVPLLLARLIYREGKYPLSLKKIFFLIFLIFLPSVLISMQPDLGNAILISLSGFLMLFLAGIYWKLIFIIGLNIILFIPFLWIFVMYDYQKYRILSFFNPNLDPCGSGYHILQSRIAIGSGGWLGKGWLKGTQSHLFFIPESSTDFIFSVLGEEFGFLGTISLLILYMIIVFRCIVIAIKNNNLFCKILCGGYIFGFFIYIFINISMVIGIIPIVGIPLPLVSYGGTTLVVSLIQFGIIISIYNYRKIFSFSL